MSKFDIEKNYKDMCESNSLCLLFLLIDCVIQIHMHKVLYQMIYDNLLLLNSNSQAIPKWSEGKHFQSFTFCVPQK